MCFLQAPDHFNSQILGIMDRIQEEEASHMYLVNITFSILRLSLKSLSIFEEGRVDEPC